MQAPLVQAPGRTLASGGEAAYVCDRQAKVLVGIDRGIVDADFVVEVRPGAATALANESDGVSAMHVLAGHDRKVRQMAVAGSDAVAVVNHDGASVSAQEIGVSDYAVGGSYHRLSV